MLEAKFWSRVQPAEADECWLWTGPVVDGNYPKVWMDQKIQGAHRVSYALAVGDLEPGMCVCHTCDNRLCVNPAHLWLGTKADNNADAHAKGRSSGGSLPGEMSPMARLTDDAVREIRSRVAAGEPKASVARDFGVCKQTVCNVISGLTWSHVN